MNNTEIITAIIGGIVSLLSVLITSLLVPWLKTKIALIKDEKVRNAIKLALELAEGTIQRVIEATSQTLVKDYIKNNNWNAETKKKVLDEVVAEVKRTLTGEQIRTITDTLSISFEEWLVTSIEAYIHLRAPND